MPLALAVATNTPHPPFLCFAIADDSTRRVGCGLDTQMLWDPEHAPEEAMDDTEIYGARPTARSAWPAWLLLLTCLGGVASAASPAAATRPAAAQVLYAATSGAGVGVYVAAEYFRNEAVLQVRLCVSAAGLVSTRGERDACGNQ